MRAPVRPIGIIGSGQLARLLALAAARMGYRTLIYDDKHGPAHDIAPGSFIAPYNDPGTLARFAEQVDVTTFEWENIPVAFLQNLQKQGVKLHPDPSILGIFSDRLHEKKTLHAAGLSPVAHLLLDKPPDWEDAARLFGFPFLIKTRRGGYDGKGQWRVENRTHLETLAHKLAARVNHPAREYIAEQYIDFTAELSIIGARAGDGQMICYDAIENIHQGGILRRSLFPGRFPEKLVSQAQNLTCTLMDKLAYVGVLAVEFFVTPQQTLLVNEVAPRVHNSGHLSVEACANSQFTQHMRIMTGLPLADVSAIASAEMINLLGDSVDSLAPYLTRKGASVTLYGKQEIRPQRKMGHVTLLSPLR